jgi:hypothetical protein
VAALIESAQEQQLIALEFARPPEARMRRRTLFLFAATLLVLLPPRSLQGRTPGKPADGETWKFAVSGDSRNCGDVVMPEIAAGVTHDGAQFYWHLGDFRAIYMMDEDFANNNLHAGLNSHGLAPSSTYLLLAWPDFIAHQILPFGSLPVFLGIGNHEMVKPKTREEYLSQFSIWLNSVPVQKQRDADYKWDWKTTTYYHWKWNGIDFINLDNATGDQFDEEQLNWFETVLAWDSTKDSPVHTIVVGMHKALPGSLSDAHSMSETEAGLKSGRRVYEDLLKMRDGKFLNEKGDAAAKKNIYVLASHSHFYMHDIFESEYWKKFGADHLGSEAAGVLKGWIVGTAGAQRYLPPMDPEASKRTILHQYGYLLGIVGQDGKIDFVFKPIDRASVTAEVSGRYSPQFIDWCFDENAQKAKH